MASLIIEFSATVPIGGETLGPDVVKSLTVGGTAHDKIDNIPGATAVTYKTFYDASVDLGMATFNFCAIVVDPTNLQATEKFVNVRITNNGVTAIEKISSFTGLKILSGSAQTTGAISKIEVGNIASTVATTDDVIVRLIAFKV